MLNPRALVVLAMICATIAVLAANQRTNLDARNLDRPRSTVSLLALAPSEAPADRAHPDMVR